MGVQANTDKELMAKCYQLIMVEKGIDFTKKVKWEEEFGVQINEQQWLTSYQNAMQISCNANLCENGIKLHLKWYYTPVIIRNMYGKGGRCWKCEEKNAGFAHVWWCSKKIKILWWKVKKKIDKSLFYSAKFTVEHR